MIVVTILKVRYCRALRRTDIILECEPAFRGCYEYLKLVVLEFTQPAPFKGTALAFKCKKDGTCDSGVPEIFEIEGGEMEPVASVLAKALSAIQHNVDD
jgi:hypothetical protein